MPDGSHNIHIHNRFKEIRSNSMRRSITIDHTRDDLITDFGRATLDERYLLPGESYQDLFARVAAAYADNFGHAQRLYDYISKMWFMPATPVLSNGGTNRGLPISCFLNESADSREGIFGLLGENANLAAKGGGIGSYWGNLRGLGEKVGQNGKTSGIIPFIHLMDAQTLAISQGSLRRGSAAVYLQVSHPEIEEFIEIRRPTGGDPNRKALNLHNGMVIPDAFMRAVETDGDWQLISPKDGHVTSTIRARALWIRILTARIETGEPYLLFSDHVKKGQPEFHRLAGLEVKTSNLCSEITLPTGIDNRGGDRTAVCCLSSLNLEKWFEWHQDEQFIEDVMSFLDNVLESFIQKAGKGFERAIYSAKRERSVGLGVMGFHSFLQDQNIPFESTVAKSWNTRFFKHIRAQADAASVKLANERGACPDASDFGVMERFSHKMAIAPTASISIIAGNTSPGIEPIAANVFMQKTLAGNFAVKNRALKLVLDKYGKDDEDTWRSITLNKGSVQELDFLSKHEKDVFKTAFEMDQRWVIEHAADRTPFICQSQSVNIFLPAKVHKRDLHGLHMLAWRLGVKSLYYCRSLSIARAESSDTARQNAISADQAAHDDGMPSERVDYSGNSCLSCQ